MAEFSQHLLRRVLPSLVSVLPVVTAFAADAGCFPDAPVVKVTEKTSPEWTLLGSFSIDRRMGHNMPGYGVFRCVETHPKNPDIILIGGDTTGIWKSADSGRTWRFVTKALPVEQAYGIRMCASNPRAVWAATDRGVMISPDAGDTWSFTKLSKPEATTKARMHCRVAVSPQNPSLAVAYADKQLLRTQDAGKTWTTLEKDVTVFDLRFHPTDGSTAYALVSRPGKGAGLSLLVSSDAGKTFRVSGEPLAFRSVHCGDLAVSPAKPDSVWFFVAGDREIRPAQGEAKKTLLAGLFRSDDRGRTFAPVKQAGGFKTLPDGMMGSPNYWPDEAEKKAYKGAKDDSFLRIGLGQIGWDHALAVSDTNPDLIVLGGTGVCHSRDGGRTWSGKREGDPVHPDIQGASLCGSLLRVVNDGGLHEVKLGDGSTPAVSRRLEGYCGQQLWGFGQSFKTGILACGVNHSTIKIYDAKRYENGWFSAGGADAQTAFVNLFDDRWVYGTPWWNEVIRRPLAPGDKIPWRKSAVDFGYIPYRTPEPHPNLIYSFFALHKETDPGNPHRTVAQQVARSDDNFLTAASLWRREGGSARRLRLRPGSAEDMVLIHSPARQVDVSRDGGKTWTDITPKGFSLSYSDAVIAENDAADITLSVSGEGDGPKVIRTRDGGKTWKDVSDGVGPCEVRTMLGLRGTRGGVYLGCHPGVYYRNDDMPAWVRCDRGMPMLDAAFLAADYAAGVVRAGTSQGVWVAPLAQDFAPRALIAASHNRVTPAAPVVKFFCHSALPAKGSSWRWSFPGGSPESSSEENPVVSYAAAKPGEYAAELRVTDAKGRSSVTRMPGFIRVGGADADLGKLKDVLLAIDDPKARYGVENSNYLARKLDEQDESSFERAEAERKALKHRARWEAFGEADDDAFQFERPGPLPE